MAVCPCVAIGLSGKVSVQSAHSFAAKLQRERRADDRGN